MAISPVDSPNASGRRPHSADGAASELAKKQILQTVNESSDAVVKPSALGDAAAAGHSDATLKV